MIIIIIQLVIIAAMTSDLVPLISCSLFSNSIETLLILTLSTSSFSNKYFILPHLRISDDIEHSNGILIIVFPFISL